MTAEFPQVGQRFVGRLTAAFVIPRPLPDARPPAAIEWSPTVPDRLTSAALDRYRRGRDAALQPLSTALGLSVLVLEL